MQDFSGFGCNNTEVAAFQWFWRFGLVFGSDTKLIDASFCIVQETVITICHVVFPRFRLRQYRDHRVSLILAVLAHIRV